MGPRIGEICYYCCSPLLTGLTAVFTKPGVHLFAKPCTEFGMMLLDTEVQSEEYFWMDDEFHDEVSAVQHNEDYGYCESVLKAWGWISSPRLDCKPC